MIVDVLTDYYEDTPGIDPDRLDKLGSILKEFDEIYLADCTDADMHYAYLCAFLYRLDRLSDEQLKDSKTAFMDENVQFYLNMDNDEKRLDAKPFRRTDQRLKKAREIRANALRCAIDKLNGQLNPADIDQIKRYRDVIRYIKTDRTPMSFSVRRETEQLLSGALLDINFILDVTSQYSPELYNFCFRNPQDQ